MKNQPIAIIDIGLSNIASVENIIKKVGGTSILIKSPKEFKTFKYNRVIFPGVGSFDAAMSILIDDGWLDGLNEYVSNYNNKILGICLGMQLMFEKSEEGTHSGLGWIKGSLKKFRLSGNIKVPHMGWNIIFPSPRSKLFSFEGSIKRFYFVHSYYAVCNDERDVAAVAEYGHKFACGIEKKNIFGVQFHPEKSHRYGMNLIKNFIIL